MEGEKYNLEQAQEEALKLQKKIKSGDASSYSEAEKQLELEEGVEQKKSAGIKLEKKEVRESIKVTGKFEKGQRGLICRNPSDGGAWVVPEDESHVSLDTVYVMEVTRSASSGKLRFVRIVETLKEHNERVKVANEQFRQKYYPLVEKALRDENNLTADYGEKKLNVMAEDGKVLTLSPHWAGSTMMFKFKSWSPFHMTDAAKHIWKQAEEDYFAKQKREKEEGEEKERQRLDQFAENRAEVVAKDAEIVTSFFDEYPQAKERLKTTGPDDIAYPPDNYSTKRIMEHLKTKGLVWNLTWKEVSGAAVELGIAKPKGPKRSTGGADKYENFQQDYALTLGGKEIVFTLHWQVEY